MVSLMQTLQFTFGRGREYRLVLLRVSISLAVAYVAAKRLRSMTNFGSQNQLCGNKLCR